MICDMLNSRRQNFGWRKRFPQNWRTSEKCETKTDHFHYPLLSTSNKYWTIHMTALCKHSNLIFVPFRDTHVSVNSDAKYLIKRLIFLIGVQVLLFNAKETKIWELQFKIWLFHIPSTGAKMLKNKTVYGHCLNRCFRKSFRCFFMKL